MPSLDELRKYCSEDVLGLNPEIFAAPPKKLTSGRNKYGARKLTFDGKTFDSTKEAQRYQELLFLQSTGDIAELQTQVSYVLQEAIVDGSGKKQRAITYTADFVYKRAGVTYIEDVKSVITAKSESFRVRWRLLLNQFKHDPNTVCLIHT